MSNFEDLSKKSMDIHFAITNVINHLAGSHIIEPLDFESSVGDNNLHISRIPRTATLNVKTEISLSYSFRKAGFVCIIDMGDGLLICLNKEQQKDFFALEAKLDRSNCLIF